MRFHLLSDNIDSAKGFRLAGITVEVIREPDALFDSLNAALEAEDVGIILITERLASYAPEKIDRLKLERPRPLIVVIPDRHGSSQAGESLVRYVRDSVGIDI